MSMDYVLPPPLFTELKRLIPWRAALSRGAFLWLCLALLCTPLLARADTSMYTLTATVGQSGSAAPSLSGTNCYASGGFTLNGSSTVTVTYIYLSVNGTLLQLVAPGGRAINQAGDGLFNPIDSTHFSDGSSITATFIVVFSDGSSMTQTASLSAYNKAYIYGNQIPPDGIGSLDLGKAAVAAVNARVTPTNHTVLPTAGQLTRLKADILADMPTPTVFYCYTHGYDGFFGDSSSVLGLNLQTYITTQGVTTAIAAKTPVQPPNLPQYNFVFLDACACGASTQLSNAFATYTFLGWGGPVADSQHNVNWTNRVFQQLAAGYDLTDAIGWASDGKNGGPEQDGFGNGVMPAVYRDHHYKLHGVYGKPKSLDWH